MEGGTLEVPLGQLRQIEFTVTFIPRGIDYHLSMLRNGRRFNVNNNDLEVKRLLSIVSRSCEDSNRPGERCLLLQVTVNGTNDIVRELNGTSFNFVVIGVDQLNPDDTSGTITVRLVGEYLKTLDLNNIISTATDCTLNDKLSNSNSFNG